MSCPGIMLVSKAQMGAKLVGLSYFQNRFKIF